LEINETGPFFFLIFVIKINKIKKEIKETKLYFIQDTLPPPAYIRINYKKTKMGNL
jgi:hypothetical protein